MAFVVKKCTIPLVIKKLNVFLNECWNLLSTTYSLKRDESLRLYNNDSFYNELLKYIYGFLKSHTREQEYILIGGVDLGFAINYQKDCILIITLLGIQIIAFKTSKISIPSIANDAALMEIKNHTVITHTKSENFHCACDAVTIISKAPEHKEYAKCIRTLLMKHTQTYKWQVIIGNHIKYYIPDTLKLDEFIHLSVMNNEVIAFHDTYHGSSMASLVKYIFQ